MIGMNYIEEKLVRYGIPLDAIEGCPDVDWEGVLRRIEYEER